jgi:DNA-binding NarL/FixJ family response regulator
VEASRRRQSMSWTIVVSADESFVRGAVDALRDNTNVVGATGAAAARTLVASLEVDAVIADAGDAVGRSILAALRIAKRAGGTRVIAVDGRSHGFPEAHVSDLTQAIENALKVA